MVSEQDVEKAVAILKRGGLVAFPTETVYGLGADAANPQALRRLYAAKGRPGDHPVIVHLADAEQLPRWASEINVTAQKLAATFWPGPLTMILRRASHVSDAVTGGQDSVGIRVPSHPVARSLLTSFGGGIAAPSANRFGRVSATAASHVIDELGNSVDMVLDGGQCNVGIESTIVDVTAIQPVILRPGHISAQQVLEAAGMDSFATPRVESPRAPGTLAAHYAPRTTLLVLEDDLIQELAATLVRQGKQVAVLARSTRQPLLENLIWISAPVAVGGYAHDLYANLRALDGADCEVILVERLPQTPEWAAVNDRLGRAAAGSSVPAAT